MYKKQILVHYGELSTKGRNKNMFQNKLADHIRFKTKEIEKIKVVPSHNFMYVKWNEMPYEQMIQILKDIPGIARFEPVYQVERTIEAIKKASVQLFKELDLKENDTFRVVAKRTFKDFEYDTYGIQREVGGAIGRAFPSLGVDLRHANHKLVVSIQKDSAFLSLTSYTGLQGMPYASSGKGLLMLSGGFDSPIAGYLMMKRGLQIEAVHFSSPPYTSPQALVKTKKLTAKLAHYGTPITFINVPFTKIQEEIKKHAPDSQSMTITRRFMLRIMERLLPLRKAEAIVNGESLGQVASQTLTSMSVINEVTSSPILRPLIASDKNDIIEIAEQIGTYDLSNEPYEDCCTVFAPTSPHTKPKLETIEQFESRLNVEDLVDEAISNIELEIIGEDYLVDKEEAFSDLL